MSACAPYLHTDHTGAVYVDVHVIPHAKHTLADGIHDGALRVRLHAPPVDGKANQALIHWLAMTLDIAKSHIELVRGHSAKRKRLKVSARMATQANWSALG